MGLRLLGACFLQALLTFAVTARAADFKVHAPGNWRQTDSMEGTTSYVNTKSASHESIVLTTLIVKEPDSDFQDNLREQLYAVEAVRSEFYERVGLENYSIISVEKKILNNSVFTSMQVIRSRFRDLAKREVQMTERQYLSGSKLYVVTYTRDGGAVDRNSTHDSVDDLILNWFQPNAARRDTASEVARGSGNLSSSAPAFRSARARTAYDMDSMQMQKRCEAVPTAQRRRFGESGLFAVGSDLLRGGLGCAKGLALSIPDFIKGTFTGLWTAGSAVLKYGFNANYRNQVNATVGVVYQQLKKDPKEFSINLAERTWDFVAKKTGDLFLCSNAQTQMRVICETLTMLNPRLLITLATRAPLIMAEESELAAAALSAIAKESKAAEAAQVAKVAESEQAVAEAGGVAPGKVKISKPSRALTARYRAAEARSGLLPKVWSAKLSKAEQNAFSEQILSRRELRESYGRLTQKMEALSKDRVEKIPAATQDAFMTNLNRAIAGLKPSEHLNTEFYESLVKNVTNANVNSAAAKTALKELQTETLVLRAVNAQAGRSLGQKLDAFFAERKLRKADISEREIQTYKRCVLGNGSVATNASANHHSLASTFFVGFAAFATEGHSCLAIATRILSGTENLSTADELTGAMVTLAKSETSGLLRDQSDLLADAARKDIHTRSDSYSKLRAENPNDKKLRAFDTIIVGGGPETVAAASNLYGTRTLVINESQEMGVFAKFGDTFYVNSGEEMSKPSPNLLPGARVQIMNLAKKVYPPGRVIGNATEINLAMTDVDFALGERALPAVRAPAGSEGKYLVRTASGEEFSADHVINITGLGKKKFPFTDEGTLNLIQDEYASGTPSIRFIEDYLTDAQLEARRGELPLKRTAGKRVVLIGPGDGGAIGAEYMLGHGPPAGYAFRTAEINDDLLPERVYWLGQKHATRAGYEANSWPRYHDLGPDIETGRLRPIDGKANKIEKISTGSDAGAFKVIYGPGPNDFVVADEVVSAAGYDQSGPGEFVSSLAEGTPDLRMAKGNPENKFATDVNIAKQVYINGSPEEVYIAGPATGGLETTGEAGGTNSPRIEVLGTRTATLAHQIKSKIKSGRSCVTCELVPETESLIVRSEGRTNMVSLNIPSKACVGCAVDKSVGIQFRLRHALTSLKIPRGLTLNLQIAVDAVKNRLCLSSSNLDVATLKMLSEKIFKNDRELMSLIGTRVDGQAPRTIAVSVSADGQSEANSIRFLESSMKANEPLDMTHAEVAVTAQLAEQSSVFAMPNPKHPGYVMEGQLLGQSSTVYGGARAGFVDVKDTGDFGLREAIFPMDPDRLCLTKGASVTLVRGSHAAHYDIGDEVNVRVGNRVELVKIIGISRDFHIAVERRTQRGRFEIQPTILPVAAIEGR